MRSRRVMNRIVEHNRCRFFAHRAGLWPRILFGEDESCRLRAGAPGAGRRDHRGDPPGGPRVPAADARGVRPRDPHRCGRGAAAVRVRVRRGPRGVYRALGRGEFRVGRSLERCSRPTGSARAWRGGACPGARAAGVPRERTTSSPRRFSPTSTPWPPSPWRATPPPRPTSPVTSNAAVRPARAPARARSRRRGRARRRGPRRRLAPAGRVAVLAALRETRLTAGFLGALGRRRGSMARRACPATSCTAGLRRPMRRGGRSDRPPRRRATAAAERRQRRSRSAPPSRSPTRPVPARLGGEADPRGRRRVEQRLPRSSSSPHSPRVDAGAASRALEPLDAEDPRESSSG